MLLKLQKFENIKQLLFSVIKNGSKSIYANEFVDICRDIALVQFRKNKYKEEVFKRECYDKKEIAYDLIADIFENREGYYFQINNFFDEIVKRINKTSKEEIIAKLVILVRSNVNQRISEIRKDYGEPYFKIKKAFDSFMKRNKESFREVVFRDIIFVYNCPDSEVDFYLQQINESIIINEIFNNKFKTYSIPEVVRNAFKFLNSQDEYCKAVIKTELLNIISKFYKIRLKDNLKIVEYINYKEEY